MPRRSHTYYQYRPFQRQWPQSNQGGFLARLFGRNQPVPTRNPFQFGAGFQQTQTPTGLFNPETITRFLGQTQQVLRTGQQIVGMYQQYGPLIRNLPALWKIYRGLNSESSQESSEEEDVNNFDDEEDEKTEEKEIDEVDFSSDEKNHDVNDDNHDEDHNISPHKNKPRKKRKRKSEFITKESVPKLYI